MLTPILLILAVGCGGLAAWLLRDRSTERLRALARGTGGHLGQETATGGNRDIQGGAGPGGPTRDGPGAVRGHKRRDKDADPAEPAIAIVDRCTALLRAGVAPAHALRQVARAGTEPGLRTLLEKVARALELGQAPHTAIRAQLARARPAPQIARILEGMASVWFVAQTAGAPAAEMLGRYAESCRARADSERERAVALAGPQSTVRVLTWLPVISLGLSLLIGTNPLELITGVPGALSLVCGVALLLAGRAWMRAMLKKAE
ncbi:type II secretion system F family protein [Brevibacterium moorei]|uniref:type II secretion system F family protein n=1 Tax=Brevibacterium moorei TaxID=2968457 RepID=UPI00211C447A|nr:type II secretion system F family protein [Brevibacterium sp. 68QC2CO]